MAVSKWFDSNVYISNKVAQLNATEPAGNWTADKVVEAFTKAGFVGAEGAEAHFMQFGQFEDVAPNAFFNPTEYYRAKAAAVYNKLDNPKSVTDAEAAFVKAAVKGLGMGAWTHYDTFGSNEKINPSNGFDTEKYMNAKMEALNANLTDGQTAYKIEDVYAAFKASGISALEHFMTFGGNGKGEVTDSYKGSIPDAFKVDPTKQVNGGGSSEDGNHYALTVEADNIIGTAGNDKIGGTNSAAGVQFSAADSIDGGAGEDTLVLDLNASYNGGASVKNVEVLAVTMDNGAGGATTFDANGISGLTKIVRTAGDANGVTFNNVASLTSLEINNTGADTTVSYLESIVGGTADTVAVTLNNVTGAAQVNINSADTNTSGVEAVALTATGLASNVTLQSNDASISKVTVAGSSNLNLVVGTNVTTTATNIDATGYTGQLNLSGMGAADHTIIGGAKNDRFQFAANFNTNDKVDGGEGVDTLSANGAQLTAITAKLANVKSIETLELANDVAAVSTTINAANFGAITNVRIANQTNADVAAVVFNGLTAAAADSSNNIRFDGDLGATGGAYTFNITGATDPATANSATLDMRGGATTATSTINLAGVETIAIDTSNATGLQTFNLGAASLKTLTVKGIQGVDIDGAALGANVESVDATGLTAGGLNVALNTTAATGAKITGSGQADRIMGSNQKDIINAGDGADTVIASGGRDEITLGAGNDIMRLDAKANVAGAAGVNVFKLIGFDASADTINLIGDGNASTVLQGVTITAGTTTAAAMQTALSSTTAANSITDVYAQLGSILNTGAFAGSAGTSAGIVARIVEFTAGDAAGKYLVINDSANGFLAADDIVIDITGVSGNFSAANFTFTA